MKLFNLTPQTQKWARIGGSTACEALAELVYLIWLCGSEKLYGLFPIKQLQPLIGILRAKTEGFQSLTGWLAQRRAL